MKKDHKGITTSETDYREVTTVRVCVCACVRGSEGVCVRTQEEFRDNICAKHGRETDSV